jgi:hypothetical protein
MEKPSERGKSSAGPVAMRAVFSFMQFATKKLLGAEE